MKKLFVSLAGLFALVPQFSVALPPPDDIPEEILRTEIILEGRSPIDGEPLTASEYALMQDRIATNPYSPELGSQVHQIIFLLEIRRLLKTVTPF